MALPININDLLNNRTIESARIEYKGNWNPEPIIHSICAFANDIDNWGGGYIIIGVEEKNGKPITPVKGLNSDSIDRINKDLLNKCNLIEPRYIPIVETVTMDEKLILVLWIPGGDARPYKCPTKFPTDKSTKYEKAYYIRKMSNTIRATSDEEKELYSLANKIPFDDRCNLQANIEDIKPTLISNFLYEVKSDLYPLATDMSLRELCRSMNLIAGPVETEKPVNVGLMFFNEQPDRFFKYSRIEVIDKPDPTGEGMTEKIFAGPIDRQLKDSLSYIKNYIIKEKISKLSDRAEAERIYNYPFAAVEEALANAVYHKSYQISEPITVTVTPERIEINSLPGPDRTITDENLRACKLVSKRYRNRRIGDFLKELKLVEGRNTGIPTMMKALKDNGSGLPIFETDEERTYFTVIIPVHEGFNIDVKTNSEASKKQRRNRDEIKEMIIALLRENGQLSKKELIGMMGYAKNTATVDAVLKTLFEANIIGYTDENNKHNINQKIQYLM